jgi:hypothetical protein
LGQEKLFSGQPVYYLLETGNLSEYWGKCQDPPLDFSRPVAGFNNVTLACIALAGYMGFHNTYLVGADHDLNHIRSLTHFYDVNPYYDERPLNLLDREYKGDYVALLERFLLTMKCYRLLGIVLGKQGTKIYNATSGGHLDVFQRVEFESLFQGSTKCQ